LPQLLPLPDSAKSGQCEEHCTYDCRKSVLSQYRLNYGYDAGDKQWYAAVSDHKPDSAKTAYLKCRFFLARLRRSKKQMEIRLNVWSATRARYPAYKLLPHVGVIDTLQWL
jgi:hypothetical protein